MTKIGFLLFDWQREKTASLSESVVLAIVYAHIHGYVGTESYLAKIIRCSRETVSRCVTSLISKGLIKKGYNDMGQRVLRISPNLRKEHPLTSEFLKEHEGFFCV